MDSKQRPFSGLFPDDFFSTTTAAIAAPAAAIDLDAAASGSRNSIANHNSNLHLHHHRVQSPTPTGRFSLRRSSIVTSSSASTFRSKSSDFKSFFSCVTRQTIPDDCARYRFIAWVAARRNECQHMNAVDKLECPLLRCRQRFSTHEDLVKHIFDCKHLAGGEYFCFEHRQAERFDDGKCKDCCGHPTRRRKILSMARSFFSNLGHKSKNKKDLVSAQSDGLYVCPPPSYESLHQELPAENQIFELPSTEPVTVQTISPTELASAAQTLAPQSTTNTTFIRPSQIHSAGPQAPLLLVEGEEEREFTSRPCLQLNTFVGTQRPIRAPPAPRSKYLSPSSSVRSNASTASSNSTVSTTSAHSLVSPISAWSETSFPLSKVPFLTEPSNVLTTTDFETDAVMADKNDLPVTEFSAEFGDFAYIPELPGDEFTVDLPSEMDDGSMVDLSPMGLENYTYGPEVPASNEPPLVANAVLAPRVITQDVMNPPLFQQATINELFGCSNPKNIIDTAWGTLGEQLSQSIHKLKGVENNPLADQIQALSTKDVAQRGLNTLELVFQYGRNPDDPMESLCLAHLIYAFSVPTYEKYAIGRYKNLFLQALAYVQELPEEYRGFYKEVVSVLWQPQDFSENEVEQFLATQQVQSLSRASSVKGKEREQPLNAASDHLKLPFVAVAQDFLDDLESAVMFNPAEPMADMAASALRELHTKAQIQAAHVHPQASQQNYSNQGPFYQAVGLLAQHYKALFSNINGFHNKLDDICQRVKAGRICSSRKAELEVLRAGKDIAVVKSIMSGLDDMPAQDLPTDWYSDFFPGDAPQQQQQQQQHQHQQQQHPTSLDHPTPSHMVIGGHSLSVGSVGSIHSLSAIHTSQSPSPHIPAFPPVTSSTMTMSPFIYSTADGQDEDFGQLAQASPTPQTPQPPTLLQPHAQPSSSSLQPRLESPDQCDICGYRPKGDPRWFQGSMAKHKKTKHANGPDKVYKCPFPGCQSAYKNREDNLKQHMKEKNHYVDPDDSQSPRPSKRKKVS